jgi:hypothetical protein
MKEENFLCWALSLQEQRKIFIIRLANKKIMKKELGYLKSAMSRNAVEFCGQACAEYFNAMINNNIILFNSLRRECDEELFEKLISAGLKVVK